MLAIAGWLLAYITVLPIIFINTPLLGCWLPLQLLLLLLANALAGFHCCCCRCYCWLAADGLLAGWMATWLAIITYIQ
jgi:hypothetical protein